MSCFSCGSDNYNVDVCCFVKVPEGASLNGNIDVAITERDLQCVEQTQLINTDYITLDSECGPGTEINDTSIVLSTISVLGGVKVQVATQIEYPDGSTSIICCHDLVSIRRDEGAPFCICPDDGNCNGINIEEDVTIIPNNDFEIIEVTDEVDSCDGSNVYKVSGTINFKLECQEVCPPELQSVEFTVTNPVNNNTATYTISFVEVNYTDTTSTWCYDVSVEGDPALSHWVLGFCPEPVAEVISASRNDIELDPDGDDAEYETPGPFNDIPGIKFEVGVADNEETVRYCVTLDERYDIAAVDVGVKGGPARQ
ncbi:MAG: hypothetical protein ACOC2J_05165, partial [bacterium]